MAGKAPDKVPEASLTLLMLESQDGLGWKGPLKRCC